MASYIKQNKDVTLQGTKRFTDKSGEYYLKNVQLQNSQRDPHSHKKMSLNNPQNLENCLNKNIDRIKRKASRIVTLLPENSLTPIPKKDGRNTGMADRYGKKELKDAERTAVFIRRMEYATSMKRQMDEDKNLKNQAKKIALIQEWWKTMYKIIKLQKNMRGFLFRKKLMNNLEHQEKLLQFITEFDNIHSYHLYKQFMDNLKKKRDYENSKLMEKCEDFNEKLDNLEKMHNLKNFKDCFQKWKDNTKQKRKEALDDLAKKLNDLLANKLHNIKKDSMDEIKNKAKSEDDKLNDKIKEFQDKHAKNKFMKDLIRAHRLNKMLNNIKNKLDDKNKRDALEKLKQKNDIERAGDKLKKMMDNNLKRKAWNDMKTMDFVNKLDDLINNHNDKVEKDAKKELVDKLKDLGNKNRLRDKLKKWKNFNDDMKNRLKILNKLKRHKLNELRKKEEQEKNKLMISSGVNDIEIKSNKEHDNNKPRSSQIFMSDPNNINILAQPNQKKPELALSGQNFSLIPSEVIKFEFAEPFTTSDKLQMQPLEDQLENVDKYLKNPEEYLLQSRKNMLDKLEKDNDKGKEEQNLESRKNMLDNLENDNPEGKAAQKLDNLVNNKDGDMNGGFRSLDKLYKDDEQKKGGNIPLGVEKLEEFMKNKQKKDAFDKLMRNADAKNALEDLDKLLLDKYKKKFMNKLKLNNDLNKASDILKNFAKLNSRKQFLDRLKKIDGLNKGMQILNKLLKNKTKKDTFDKFKKNDKIALGTNDLEKLITNKLRQKFMDRINSGGDVKNACNKLDRLMNNNLKRTAFNILKKKIRLEKAVEKLDKLIKDKNDKDKKDTFDKLKKNDAIAQGVNKLDKIVTNKLKKDAIDQLKKNDEIAKALQKIDNIMKNKLRDDTLYKLKTMYFVDILEKMKKKHEDNDKNEKLQNLMNNLKSIRDKAKEEEKSKLDNLAKYFNKWRGNCETKEIFHSFTNFTKKKIYLHKLKDKADRMKIKDKLIDNAKKQKALDHWRTIKDLRNILDLFKKMKYFDKWLDKCEIIEIMQSFKVIRNTKKQKFFLHRIKKNENDNLKKYFDKWKEIAFKPVYKSKRISRRHSPKKLRKKGRNNNYKKLANKADKNKKLLRKYFDKWRKISSFSERRDVLEQIKKNKLLNDNLEKNNLYNNKLSYNKIYNKNLENLDNLEGLNDIDKKNLLQKYKNKVLRVVLNIYKSQRNILLKKYFDIWKKATIPKSEKKEKDIIIKYKKKPKIRDNKDYNDYLNNDTNKDSFKPTYIISSKKNLYGMGGRVYDINSNDVYKEKFTQTMSDFKQNPKNMYDNHSYTNIKNRNMPYRKKYGQRGLEYDFSSNNPEDFRRKYAQKMFDNDQLLNPEDYNYNYNNYNYEELPKDKEIHVNNNGNLNINSLNNNLNNLNNLDEKNRRDNFINNMNNNNIKDIKGREMGKENEQQLFSDSSINDSLLSGVTLIQNFKETKQPRNYTSQSFFIDKNIVNNLAKNNNNYQLNSHNPNQMPMTMKGDFVSLIGQNPKILAQKNPRIQVTNATCDLNEIINNENNTDTDEMNTEEMNSEIDKLKNNYIIDKNKVLTKVIQNCDKDLYASQKPFVSKKEQWYSVSIPLNDNEARWEFLNNIKGERDKNNLNKFELIQNEMDLNKKEDREKEKDKDKEEQYNTRTFKDLRTEKKKPLTKENKDTSYKLREMNFSQFYRSPNRTRNPNITNDNDKTSVGRTYIKRPGQRRKMQGSQSYINITNSGRKNKNIGSNNIDRSKGKIQLDPKFKSIQYDDEGDEYNYSEE